MNALGLNGRQIKKLLEEGEVSKIKKGYYELADEVNPEEIIIARLFPDAVIFLESALLHYNYTDRIPTAWQIAVDRDSEKVGMISNTHRWNLIIKKLNSLVLVFQHLKFKE